MDGLEHFKQDFAGLSIETCSITIAYVGRLDNDSPRIAELWSASVVAGPIPLDESADFQVRAEELVAGRVALNRQTGSHLAHVIHEGALGRLAVDGIQLVMPGVHSHDPPTNRVSQPATRDTWFNQPALRITSKSPVQPYSGLQLARLENALRRAAPPFDGMGDLLGNLGLRNVVGTGQPAQLEIVVSPPVDLLLDACSLADDALHLELISNRLFPSDQIHIAVVGLPTTVRRRLQVAEQTVWNPVPDDRGFLRGLVTLSLPDCHSALVMLSAGNTLVRRQFIADISKAQNNRLLAVQAFDEGLKKLRERLLDPARDSRGFERAVCQLVFLLGFNSNQQLEEEAPDIIVSTPAGRIVVVECTVKTSDLASKLGKLVDRRTRLAKALAAQGHTLPVIALLVSQQAREQIVEADLIKRNQVLLATLEDLSRGLDRLRVPQDPDVLLADALQVQSAGQ